MEEIQKKRVLSCIQPSGMLTLGNYLGALKSWVKMQEDFEQKLPHDHVLVSASSCLGMALAIAGVVIAIASMI